MSPIGGAANGERETAISKFCFCSLITMLYLFESPIIFFLLHKQSELYYMKLTWSRKR